MDQYNGLLALFQPEREALRLVIGKVMEDKKLKIALGGKEQTASVFHRPDWIKPEGLWKGDKLAMLTADGGQSYYILYKVVE